MAPAELAKVQEIAILACGCFWGVQHALRRIPGVLSTRAGYTGGDVQNATYRHHGTHAEAVEVIFNPEVLSFAKLLDTFFKIHDPTTLNRQGHDIGPSYRSAIFYVSDAQKAIAGEIIANIDASGLWPDPIVTEVVAASAFWEAEPEHQNFLER